MRETVTERIFRALFIARAGLTIRELASIVYADDPTGGALDYQGSLSVLIYRLNCRHLVPRGAKIVADWGPGSRYRLTMLRPNLT